MESPGACTANSIKSVCIEVFISSPQPHDLIGWGGPWSHCISQLTCPPKPPFTIAPDQDSRCHGHGGWMSLWWGRPVHCMVLGRLPGWHPLEAGSTPPPGATPKMPLDVAQCTLGAGTPFPPCPRPHSSRQRALLGRVYSV